MLPHRDITKLQNPSQDSCLLHVENDARRLSQADSAFTDSPYVSRKGSCSSDVFDPLDHSMSKESCFGSPMTEARQNRSRDKILYSEEIEKPTQ